MKLSIGIDPGVSGGIVMLIESGTIRIASCPDTVNDMANILSEFDYINFKARAVIERVHSFPGQGVTSTFKFGMNYGQWLGILAALKIPYIQVAPSKWMKHYGRMPKNKKDRKNHLKHLAQQQFPKERITLKTADAILLAVYGMEENR